MVNLVKSLDLGLRNSAAHGATASRVKLHSVTYGKVLTFVGL